MSDQPLVLIRAMYTRATRHSSLMYISASALECAHTTARTYVSMAEKNNSAMCENKLFRVMYGFDAITLAAFICLYACRQHI